MLRLDPVKHPSYENLEGLLLEQFYQAVARAVPGNIPSLHSQPVDSGMGVTFLRRAVLELLVSGLVRSRL